MLCKGAAVCWLISELMVMSSAIYFIHNKTSISLPFNLLKQRFIPLFIISICSYFMHITFSDIHVLIRLILSALIMVFTTYSVEKFLVKNPIVHEIDNWTINLIKNKWKK